MGKYYRTTVHYHSVNRAHLRNHGNAGERAQVQQECACAGWLLWCPSAGVPLPPSSQAADATVPTKPFATTLFQQ